MTRALLVWGGAAAAILGLGALMVALTLASSATPANHVQRYLDALARDDLASAARLAGLQPPTAMPLGDDGEPSIHRIVSTETERDGTVTIVAEYGVVTDAALVTFRLKPAPPTIALVPTWAFVSPPVATLSVAADEHDRFAVNDRAVVAAGAGEPVTVTAFVPARVTVRLDDALLRAEPVTVRAGTGASDSIVLAVAPAERLERTVRREVERLLLTCTDQQVLQPTGCPFGIDIIDRVTAPPLWRLNGALVLVIEPGDNPGVWHVRGEGSAQLTVSVQNLFDGVITERDEPVGFIVRGEVVLDPDGPVLTIYPPGG